MSCMISTIPVELGESSSDHLTLHNSAARAIRAAELYASYHTSCAILLQNLRLHELGMVDPRILDT